MDMAGYYALHWPRYLTEKLGIQVREEDYTEPFVQYLKKYQRGTGNLVP